MTSAELTKYEYYRDDSGVLYCGDCLEIMPLLENESIDLVLTDPPYGDNIGYGRMGKTIQNNEDVTINYRALDIIYPKLKQDKSCYLFTNWKFEVLLRKHITESDFGLKMLLIVVKNNIGMGQAFRNQYELCLALEKGVAEYRDSGMSNVLKMEHIEHDENTHPHEKGQAMLGKLINHSSDKGDSILDPFAGSGTTLRACKDLGRKWIGIEISKKYCDIIVKRMGQEVLTFE